MDFKAIQIVCMAVSTLLEEMNWGVYGTQEFHTPVLVEEADCRKLDLLIDMMGTLTRMMDTRLNFVTTEGKVIREWIETILEVGGRYLRELQTLEKLETTVKTKFSVD